MAQRDTTNFRTVTQNIAKRPNQLPQVVAAVGTEILKQGQEAKINEGISQVQLDLQKLTQQYQVDNEKNPADALDDFRTKRQELFDSYGSQISPLYRKYWNESVRKIGSQNDATQQGWVIKQTRVNTVNSINDSMKNNFKLANMNGQNFGNGDETEIGALMDFANSQEHLQAFGEKNLGSETTKQMLEGYSDDYMKSFLSGVSDVNPIKALKLLYDERVMASFKDVDQYNTMKSHIENRALNAGKIASQKETLGALRSENGLLAQSLVKPVGYVELQNEMDRLNLSPASRNFFLSANGYEKNKVGKLTEEQKGEIKETIYNKILDMGNDGNEISSETIKGLQTEIYAAAQKKALTPKETATWLNQILVPYIDQKERSLTEYSDNAWVADDLGLKGMQKAFDSSIEIHPADGDKKVGVLTQRANMKNRIRLYDRYMEFLGKEAASRNKSVGDIPNMERTERRAIYAKAQKAAIQSFNAENYPELEGQENTPNAVIPVITSPSDLMETYQSKDGKTIISREEIIKTARGRKMSPQAVVDLLRNKGVIQ